LFIIILHKIGAFLFGSKAALLLFPEALFFMVAVYEHLGNLESLKNTGARILSVLKQSVLQALLGIAFRRRQNSVNESRDRVNNDSRRQLTARKNVVADGKLLIDLELDNTLVDALIVTAKKDEVVVIFEFLGFFLVEKRTLR
jgi:hypothetical protein